MIIEIIQALILLFTHDPDKLNAEPLATEVITVEGGEK